MIANRLFADGKTPSDLSVTQTLGHQRKHFPLARGERGECGILAASYALEVHEFQHLIAEPVPRRLVLEKYVVFRLEFDELRTRDAGGKDVSFSYRDDGLATRMQHQRW